MRLGGGQIARNRENGNKGMTRNDITGDAIASKPNSDAFREGHERLWPKRTKEKTDGNARPDSEGRIPGRDGVNGLEDGERGIG